MGKIGKAYLAGDYDRTIELLTNAIEDNPFDPHLYFFRWKLYFQLQDYHLAKWDFLTVKILKPDYQTLSFSMKKHLLYLVNYRIIRLTSYPYYTLQELK